MVVDPVMCSCSGVSAVHPTKLLCLGLLVINNATPGSRIKAKRREIPPSVERAWAILSHKLSLSFPQRPLNRVAERLDAVFNPGVLEARELNDTSLGGKAMAVD